MNSPVTRCHAQGSNDPLESNDAIVSRLAQQDKVPWYRKPNLRLLYLLMLPAAIGVETIFDSSMINGLQAVPSWLDYFHNPRSASLGLMAAMHPLGSVAAVPFAPFVVDKFGRRLPIFFGGLLGIIGGLIQGSALGFAMFIFARFMLGFASTFSLVASLCMIGELSYPKERAVIGGFVFVCYYTGSIAAAGVTLVTFSMENNLGWRIPSFLQAVPALLQVVFICLIPESPRWLISRGRNREAQAIIVKYHAEGDENSEFAKAEFTQIQQAIEVGVKIARMNYMQSFLTPGMRKRIVIAIFLGVAPQWSGFSMISNYLPPILDNIGIHDNWTKIIVNLAKTCWEFVNGTTTSLIVTRYPRRRMYLACTISLFTVVSIFTIANADYSATHSKFSTQVVLVLIFLYGPAFNLAYGSVTPAYMPELFPFHVRATGIALREWCNRGAAFLAQFINPIGIDVLGWRWYIVFCLWNAFQVVFIYLMFPETSGRTLEELTFLYEEDRDVLEADRVGMLREHDGAMTYGTMEVGLL